MSNQNQFVRRTTAVLLAGGLIVGLLPGFAAAQDRPTPPTGNFYTSTNIPPNIVLVLADDLGYMDLSLRGSNYYETPNIDRFSKEGMEFTQFYTPPTCAPSRVALLTGKSPARLNTTCVGRLPGPAEERPRTLPPSDFSLPKIMKASGYETAIMGKWGLPGAVDNGFNIQKIGNGIVQSHFYPWYESRKSALPVAKEGEYLADVLTSEASKFMESTKEKPFFLYLSHYAVHTPIQAPKKLITKYKEKSPDLDGGHSNPTYAAMVENFDTNFGKLLSKIDQLGLSQNTIILTLSSLY